MNAAKFRQLALDFPGATEGSHMGHADFRVGGKVFASLAPPPGESLLRSAHVRLININAGAELKETAC